ncbi:MAG: aminotransferase class IV [Chitinophagales bacterium]|nr:MAG: aminotransferase class IV [Chitinophagales bacterium]
MRWVNHNGKLLQADVSLFENTNRSFRYGDGLFESMIAFPDTIPFYTLHSERLQRGMLVLSMQCASPYSLKTIEHLILDLLKHQASAPVFSVRLTMFRKGNGKYQPQSHHAEFLIEAEPLKQKLFALNKEGLRICIFSGQRKAPGLLSPFKTTSALVYVLAALYARKRKADDSIIVNTSGNICEASSSNIFLLSKNHLLTPPISEGCVDGIMRRIVIRLAQDNGIAVKEKKITPQMLKQADEVFLTNALSGIRWVKHFENYSYGHELATRLSALLQTQVLRTSSW